MFFFSAPSADRRETLPGDQKYVRFYNVCPKMLVAFPSKNWRPKTCRIRGDFEQLQTSIANRLSAEQMEISKIRIACDRAKKSPVNFGPLATKLDMWVWTHLNRVFRKTPFWPLGSAVPQILHALENGQGLLAHTPTWTAVPQQFVTTNIQKLAYNLVY